MEEIRFEVRHPDGRTERLVVQSTKATIGMGAHCDVRLAVDQAAAEHVAVELAPEGLRLRSLAATPPALLDGARLAVSVVPQWGLLTIGATQIHVARAVREQAAKKGAVNSTTLLRIACLVALPLAFFALPPVDGQGASISAPPLPALFDGPAASCPRADPSEARVVAEDQRALADAARERSPFAPQESIAAVKAYEVAAACFRVAHADAAAVEATAASQGLRDDTNLDLRARSVRLERMLAVADYEIAASDVAVLRILTEGHQDRYSTWLGNVEQQLKGKGVNR